MYQNCI